MRTFLTCLTAALCLSSPSAGAAPVIVTSHTTGTIVIGSPALFILGLELDASMYDAPLPFSLRLESVFDPDAPDVYQDPWGNPTDYSTDVSFNLSVGDLALSYTGQALTSLGLSSRGNYVHTIDLPYWTYDLTLSNFLSGPPHVMGSNPFALRDLDAGAGLSGSFDLALWPQNPETSIWWGDGADSQVATLQVVSAIPEPAAPVLLAAGLMIVAARMRQQRKRLCSPPDR